MDRRITPYPIAVSDMLATRLADVPGAQTGDHRRVTRQAEVGVLPYLGRARPRGGNA